MAVRKKGRRKTNVHYRIPESGDEFALLKIQGQSFPRQPDAKEGQVQRWQHDKRDPTTDFARCLIHWCMEDA